MTEVRQHPLLVFVIFALSTLAGNRIASAQGFSVGSLDTPSVPYGASGIYTLINDRRATQDGYVRAVTLLWSEAPCAGAVKIKQFRKIPGGYQFIAQRGPFDITGHSTTFATNPALNFVAGDMLAVTVLTACGSPMIHAPAPGGAVYPFGGDLTSDVFPPNNPPQPTASLNIIGYDQTSALSLLGNRFTLSLTLVDPRTGRTVLGTPVRETDRSGYFSAPGFTGDDTLPEIVVKMADATALPSPFGGSFWVIYSSLTDTSYTLSVTDTLHGTKKEYRGSTPFCGGADTSAFPP
jgi:hypothetical protein